MRLAWFSPLPPVRSGIAADNAELLARLDGEHAIDRFVDGAPAADAARTFDAHDFVWKARRDRYDLVVYQLGNAVCHDYVWAYLAAYPGLVVVHDPRLHQARARLLLGRGRFEDYRAEFRYDHPDAPPGMAEYAVEGLGGPIYYFWSMLRSVVRTARTVAVHNARVAEELREQFPGAQIEAIRLGKAPAAAAPDARQRTRTALGVPDACVVFAVFGTLTAEKRVSPIVRAFADLVRGGLDAHLLLAGDASACPALAADLAAAAVPDRVHVTGYLEDQEIGRYLAASDVCLCLRWPTAQETSASWLQCLAAGRPTVVTDLAHTVDVPSEVALRVDLLDEDRSLAVAMRRLASDRPLREQLGRAGHAYWQAHHTFASTIDDYRRLIATAAERPAPAPRDLPAHFTSDHSAHARTLLRQFGLSVDVV